MESVRGAGPNVASMVVPVDGSEHAKRAAKVAIELTSAYGATLTFISVVAAPPFYISGTVGAPADLGDYYRAEMGDATAALAAASALAKESGVAAKSQVLRLDKSVVEAIADFALSEKADLIVIGTRGLGGFKKLLLGSVSSGVIANAPCAVLVVR